jgi:hypothetical protein
MDQSATGREPRIGSDRGFGLTVGAVLLAFGLWGLLRGHGPLSIGVPSAAGAALVILGLTAPRLLGAANRAWFRLGLLLGRIVAPLVMGVVFLTTVLPTGLIMRLVGKDPLRLRGRGDESFWVVRTHTSSFRDQF